ncbi:unnamed protein product [Aphanomyces euteiches]
MAQVPRKSSRNVRTSSDDGGNGTGNEVWTTFYNPDFGMVSSTGARASKDAEPDPDMWASIYSLLHNKREIDDAEEAPKKKKRIRVYNNKSVVQELEAEICELQAQLIQAKESAKTKTEVSVWEAAAKQQRKEKNKSMEENKQLQHAIHERNLYIERLQKAILKTPRWTALPDVASDEESRSIPADPALRIAAIHRMANYHHSRTQHAFIQAGVFHLNEDLHKSEPISLPNGQLGFRSVNNILLPAPYQVIARACWVVLNGKYSGISRDYENETWERIDDCTVYNKFWARPTDAITCHSNEVRKIYEESDRTLIVTVSTLSDETVKNESNDVVDDMNTWWQFTPHPDNPDESYMTVIGYTNISRLIEHEEVNAKPDDVIAEMRRVIRAMQTASDTDPPTFLRLLMDHRRRLRNPLQTSIEHAIYEHSGRRPRIHVKYSR